MARGVELTEGELVVVLVVEDIEEGGEEWVEVLEGGEVEGERGEDTGDGR